ncbi:DEAD/DEAH box helicase [Neptunomonas antarctica]|uniref:DNA repair protein RadD n=1 Tax=Neptunomonas antarctica TaxID=619304 RepID=A0A1N7K917_9GAMM|nr:DEAD/DEAH box helicase [Neptunomonas antarctica]SIS58040.1 DNA repair protein RadD [Neptunomonas antarctica]
MKPFTLRDYQQEAVDLTIQHFRQSNDSAVIVLPTGAGKSLVIATLAKQARGKVLVLAHVKELVEQNHHKFTELGIDAGLYSAGLKQKETHHNVTFASIQSISRNLEALGSAYSLLVIDECHRLSDDADSQYLKTISHLKSLNPNLKVLGLTATPYRMGLGWIYQYHYRGYIRSNEPRPFKHCIYELPLRYMITKGYLTRPEVIDAAIAQYDFSSITPNAFGQLPEKPVNELLTRCKRVTQAIIQQVETLAANRQGVMIFAATVLHAQEITSYLPANQTALITGETPHAIRDEYIRAFKQKELKYLVNVSVLTTGFDAPHVDVIALLRPTQSVSLYQQIIGRGLRLSPDKEDCLIIDYAGNNFNLFHPEVGEPKPNSQSEPVQVFCPLCEFSNIFWGIKDDNGFVIEHYGRRCQHAEKDEKGKITRCEYRFRFKSCSYCGAENDIAARQCHQCSKAITDPDEQLKKALQLKDALILRCAGISIEASDVKVIVTYHDEHGESLKESFNFSAPAQRYIFNQFYGRRFKNSTQPMNFSTVEEVMKNQQNLTSPDFVIARKKGKFWRIQTRIFDYEGNFRKANQLN